MQLKNYKWLLMPFCLVFGLAVVYAFVKTSQDYLSDYKHENSKEFVGKGMALDSLAAHLEDERITAFSANQLNPTYVLLFWSVTCAPCLKDLAELSPPGSTTLIVPINTDKLKDLEHAHKIFSMLVKGLPFLHDKNRFLQEQLKIKYLPTHVTLDKEGLITKFQVGKI